MFIDPDGNPLTFSAQQTGGVPLPNQITFNHLHATTHGIIGKFNFFANTDHCQRSARTYYQYQFHFAIDCTQPGFNFQSLTSAFSALGSAALTVLGYMWWRRNAANHRVGYEFANTLRRVLNLEYFDFTKDKGELYKTHIERLLSHFEHKYNDFYTALTSKEERNSFVVCVAEIIQSKDLLRKASCLWATHNRFFLFNRSWANSLDLDKFGEETSQIAQEAVAAWRKNLSELMVIRYTLAVPSIKCF